MHNLETLSIVPILRIFDEVKAREFYIDWLGFTIDFEFRFEPGTPIYMGVSLGNTRFHLSEHHGDGSPNTLLNIYCKGLRAFHQSLKPYKYYRPSIEKYQWEEGCISMMLTDPFNNRITFIEREG